MKCFPKYTVLPAIVIALFNTQISNAQSPSSQSELRAEIRDVPHGTSTPMFEVELSNIGDHDLVLNLGIMLGNGRQQYADTIHLVLRDTQNSIEMLDLKGPSVVAGRVDPFVVPLPRGARIILPINLAEYWVQKQKIFDIKLKPGRYFLSAEYRGEGVKFANLDMPGIRLMPYWLGQINSNETSFVVPGE
jgi:hypothetical protein